MERNYNDIQKEVERVGYEIVKVKKGRRHNECIVLAYSSVKKEYVTWVYNADYNGLFSGVYTNHWFNITKDDALEFALRNFDSRN